VSRRAFGERVEFFPIRHHSPACAIALRRAFDALRPARVLVEAPVDFTPLIGQLTDPNVRPPIAIVSLPAEGKGDDGGIATYPFCEHSPELVALHWARRHGAEAELIDLPVRHREMQRRYEGSPGPGPLIEDWRLDHNTYVDELCARRGVADGATLWDALFESQGPHPDWRGFFQSVATYCEHIRAVTPVEEMKGDGTLAREAHMAARVAAALETAAGPVAVVTGGFHTPALRQGAQARAKADKAPAQRAYLIRYGNRQLDRANGYGAGLPHPAWYERLWRAFEAEEDPGGLVGDMLAAFAAHLRATQPALALATPTLATATLAASRLAALRDLPFPGRVELIDGLRSAGVKDAIELGRTPLLSALDAFLTGDRIGELPPGAPQPPIVECVRARARSLGFTLDGGARRTRELDVLRKPRHGEASRFLYALDLVDAGFAERISGPDPLTGWRDDVLFETWGYAWSPLVESRLIARAMDGGTLEALCAAELERRHAALAEQGQARSAAAVVRLLLAAARTGEATLVARALAWCSEAFAEDAEVASVVAALSLTAGLEARTGSLGEGGRALRRDGFERLLMLLPHAARTPPDRLAETLKALADLAALAAEDDTAVDAERLGEAVGQALDAAPGPALAGAFAALAGLIGVLTETEVAERIGAALAGTYLEVGARAAALSGCLAVNPRLIVVSEPLLAAADRFLGELDPETFLSLLPELRLGLSALAPVEIDRVAEWVAARHGLSPQDMAEDAAPALEVAENLRVAERLTAGWRADGLAAWMEAP
jgi:hypothetical protein